jgi:hypothetical protein
MTEGKPHPLMEIQKGDEVLDIFYEGRYLVGLNVYRKENNLVYMLRATTTERVRGDNHRIIMGFISVGTQSKDKYDQNPKEYMYTNQEWGMW